MNICMISSNSYIKKNLIIRHLKITDTPQQTGFVERNRILLGLGDWPKQIKNINHMSKVPHANAIGSLICCVVY